MGGAAAKEGDAINVTETHNCTLINGNPGLGSFTFTSTINGALSADVFVMGGKAAVNGSTASGSPSHTPTGSWTLVTPVANTGAVSEGSTSVLINGKGAARHGDKATGCSDAIPPIPTGNVSVGNASSASVFIGD